MSAVTRATTLTAFANRGRTGRRPPDARSRAAADVRREIPPHLVHPHLSASSSAVEAEWRRFERTADCTAFQTFDWLAAWQKHVGERRDVRPVVAVGRFADGDIAFILPLCVMRGAFGAAAVLARPGFMRLQRAAPRPRIFRSASRRESFLAAWHELQVQMQCEPPLRHDWIEFEKMPETVGAQTNPFTYLGVSPNRQQRASGSTWATTGKNSTTPNARRRPAAATAPSAGICRNSATFVL